MSPLPATPNRSTQARPRCCSDDSNAAPALRSRSRCRLAARAWTSTAAVIRSSHRDRDAPGRDESLRRIRLCGARRTCSPLRQARAGPVAVNAVARPGSFDDHASRAATPASATAAARRASGRSRPGRRSRSGSARRRTAAAGSSARARAAPRAAARGLAVLDQVELRLGLPERGGEPRPVPERASVVPRRLVQGRRCAAPWAASPSSTTSTSSPRCRGDLARPGGAAVALAQLGGGVVDPRLQLAQPAGHADRVERSRKCRSTSPVIVGTAKDRKSTPRSGSNRSTARINPSVATCSRSSRVLPAVAVLAGDVLGHGQVPGDQLARAAAPGGGGPRAARRARRTAAPGARSRCGAGPARSVPSQKSSPSSPPPRVRRLTPIGGARPRTQGGEGNAPKATPSFWHQPTEPCADRNLREASSMACPRSRSTRTATRPVWHRLIAGKARSRSGGRRPARKHGREVTS